MSIIVQKYGGSSVADADKLRKVATKVCACRADGHDVVVVVSAMGKSTNELLALAKQMAPNPPRRELDMLLTVGERITCALLSIAIQEQGYEAISLTGSQCGILTNDRHSDARIIEVRPIRVEDELARGRIVIVAGFQGVSYKREITTLGRGGSDTTAVALAAALDADRCEIYSDVDGVYSADPNQVPQAQPIPTLSYEEMQEMATSGAKVLKAEAVEFAKRAGIAIYARASFRPGRETVVRKDAPEEQHGVRAVVSERDVALVGFLGRAVTECFLDILAAAEGGMAQIKELSFRCPEEQISWARGSFVVSTGSLPDWSKTREALLAAGGGDLEILDGLAALSLIGVGVNRDTGNVVQATKVMRDIDAPILGLSTSRFRISFITRDEHLDDAVRAMHNAFVDEQAQPIPLETE
ncbi:MAG: aspartate kinase [Deltaproteobacteria bacterium]|nr:aspartate kinase [Deltaproteobacteria bacterium]